MNFMESVCLELGRKLDELATGIVMQSADPADPAGWSASIASLGQLALGCDLTEFASIANSLAQEIGAPQYSVTDQIARQQFAQAIERLRAALATGQLNDEPSTNASLADDPELIRDFVLESREHLESIESQVLTLEGDCTNLEAIHSVFRSFHTIKGLAGFLGFDVIQQLAHEVETVLDLARNQELTITEPVIDVVLESKDFLSGCVKMLEAGGAANLQLAPDAGLLRRIDSFINTQPAVSALVPGEETAEASPAAAQKPEPVSSPAQSTKSTARSVKIDTEKVDYLVDMVGEMVIAQSLVRHDPDLKLEGNSRLGRNLAQLVRITEEVQRTAMAMRMVPVGPLFRKMVRLVRDLSKKCGKQIRVEVSGEDVELDRNIVEELGDPLMHMIRNSVDHGIEPPEERIKAGKDATALVRLRAFHRSGHMVIEVSDDGRGINKKKVLERARKNGLIAATAQLNEAECHNLIFQPGFSTADKVSDVSGRGVGMDVVRKQIQKLRGSVDLDSIEGRGATFGLRLPLTLAIIDGLVVSTGSERYILPLASVKELFRPVAGQVSTIEGRAEVVSVRDRLFPVLRLYEKFRIEPNTRDPLSSVFVLAEIDTACFCIMVDDLIGKQEVVIKSLGDSLRNVAGIAGGAILGDGHVGLIIDLHTLFAGTHNV